MDIDYPGHVASGRDQVLRVLGQAEIYIGVQMICCSILQALRFAKGWIGLKSHQNAGQVIVRNRCEMNQSGQLKSIVISSQYLDCNMLMLSGCQ